MTTIQVIWFFNLNFDRDKESRASANKMENLFINMKKYFNLPH